MKYEDIAKAGNGSPRVQWRMLRDLEDKTEEWHSHVCFGLFISTMSSERPIAHILIEDFLSQACKGDTSKTEEYLEDFEVAMGWYLPKIKMERTGKYSLNYYIDVTKVNGVKFLGIMNAYKALRENIAVPLAYLYLKEHYQKELDVWQRFVAAHCFKAFGLYKGVHGDQKTIAPQFVKHLKNLSLEKITDYFDTKKELTLSLIETRSFNLGNLVGKGSMNYQFCPAPWSYTTFKAGDRVYIPYTGLPLNDKGVQYILDDNKDKANVI